jgi:hypothetical protein
MRWDNMIQWVEHEGSIVITKCDFTRYFSNPIWPLLGNEDYRMTKEGERNTEVVWLQDNRRVSQSIFVGNTMSVDLWDEVTRAIQEAHRLIRAATLESHTHVLDLRDPI